MADRKRRAPQKNTQTSPTPEPDELRATLQAARQGPLISWPFRVLLALFTYHWKKIHAEAFGREEGGKGPAFSLNPLVVMVGAAVLLALMEYYGSSSYLNGTLKSLAKGGGGWAEWARSILSGQYLELYGFIYWSLCRFLGYLVLPAVLVLFLRGERLSDYGLSLKSASAHLWLYLLLFLAVFPAVVIASYGPGFLKTYPFYKQAGRSFYDFAVFELFYALQFFSLEFFFRGFLLQSMRRHVGAHAITFMIVPYCMIHFGKPFAETIGAIGAGLILGTLAMRTRSIWGGVAIHIAVAWSMDLLALWHKNALPF
jgi:uncharacterized protein